MADAPTFEDDLESIGFVAQGQRKRGGTTWRLDLNRYLSVDVHDFGEELVLTWAFALGEFALSRGWQIGAGETTFQELFPQRDVRLPVDAAAVRAEVVRVLSTLQLDLGDPTL